MSRSNPVRLVCQQCNQAFDAYDHRANRPTKYCSRACRDLGISTRVQLQCIQCGCQFERKAYMAEWSKDRGPFCGFACYGRWQSENVSGEANPNFVPASTARGAGQFYRNREACKARDGYRCTRCGSTNRLHSHHIREWNPDDPTTNELDNLVTLCASCHRKAHPMRRGPDGKIVSKL